MCSGISKKGTKEFTFEERKIIDECLSENFTYAEIARQVKRPVSSVKNEIHRNGGRNFYRCHKAQERAEAMKKIRYHKQLQMFSEKKEIDNNLLTFSELKDKIQTLEQLIEIILEHLGIKNE